jgi:hypothetical protein
LEERPAALVIPIPPGKVAIGCFTTPFDARAVSTKDLVNIEVSDPQGFWTDAELPCPDVDESRGEHLLPTASQATMENVEEFARSTVSGVRQTDRMDPIFYSGDQRTQGLAVYRDEKVVALLWRRIPEWGSPFGGLHILACSGSGIAG